MNCFPCFSSQKSKESNSKKDHDHSFHPEPHPQPTEHVAKEAPTVTPADYETATSINAFNFREMLSATKNFREEFLLGEGSHGKVYKGTLQGKEVAVKQLDRAAMEGNNEFFVEVGQLSLLQHSNLVSLIGYCNDGDQRLLVYEFMSGGSLEDHLHGEKAGGTPLDWLTRMKIAYGAAEGLQYLHEKAKPAVLYRDLQSSKILLDDEFHPKLSNVGLDRIGSSADSKMPMQSRMMDNTGYNAPELTNSGTISTMTDVYSFGVVLLELITGRKALDYSQPQDQQSLVDWAQPIFKEPKNFPHMADPLLKKRFPERGLNQAVAMAAMCVQEEAAARPLISDLVSVLSFLSIAKEEDNTPTTLPPSISSKLHCLSNKLQFLDCNDQSGKLQTEVITPIDEGENEDDEGSTSGCSDEETDHPNKADGDGDGDGDGNGNHSISRKSSGRSLFSTKNDSGRESNSTSRKRSKKSGSYSSCGNEDDDDNKLAASSSGDDADADAPDASAASSNKKTRKKSVDESDNNTSQKSSKKSSDKTKSRKKKKKMKDGTKKSNGESNSSAATKKKRHKHKKRRDKDDDDDLA